MNFADLQFTSSLRILVGVILIWLSVALGSPSRPWRAVAPVRGGSSVRQP
ncbi:hypothetical protein PV367_11840 [Streptomyces europaeiscabiei]|uniref:Uncharacterized protein n=1 Tax=Streptomyces europaeiscabiei TaxID=146819 RepID=A0AAJ2ULA1_9ACTN|nr:hypothetical protein [Streptomyces europaeiscabiei]MDX3130471.1 hypothetical protein [Streptomyces europaeiscabiei]